MPKTKFVPVTDTRRLKIFESVGLESETSLAVAVEAAFRRAQSEHPTLPEWYPLGARNAAAISALRMALEATGNWSRWQRSNLHGVKHLQTGQFIAVHNCCERTGLDLSDKLPRFVSARKRSATKSLRDDHQAELALEVVDKMPSVENDGLDWSPENASLHDTPAHLCIYINSETLETGEARFEVRAELLIDGSCTDGGFVSARYRLPLDLLGLADSVADIGKASSDAPGEGGVFEADVSIRKRGE